MEGIHGSRRLLLVDDDDSVRRVLRVVCEAEGFEVVGEASNGADAVRLCSLHQPDVVILDQRMPWLDGGDAAGILRTMAPGVKIVAFSAALQRKPDWSDAYLEKERILEVVPVMQDLLATA
ncbi:MAG: response regulator transcription factor [Actinomycetota bacterium]